MLRSKYGVEWTKHVLEEMDKIRARGYHFFNRYFKVSFKYLIYFEILNLQI